MATMVRFYLLGFETAEGKCTTRSVGNFLNALEKKLVTDRHRIFIPVGIEHLRIFSYYRDEYQPLGRFVIPFGKLKNGVTYKSEVGGLSLEEVGDRLFDINSLYVDTSGPIALLTCDKSGPSYRLVEQYLNAFVPAGDPIRIKLTPIFRQSSLEKIKNSPKVSSLDIALNLDRHIQKHYGEHLEEEERGFLPYLGKLASRSQGDLKAKQLHLILTLGQEGKSKEVTMDKTYLIDLLEEISGNIDEDALKEVTVRYQDNVTGKGDEFKLVNSEIRLQHTFPLKAKSLSPEYLKDNGRQALQEKQAEYYFQAQTYTSALIPAQELDLLEGEKALMQ